MLRKNFIKIYSIQTKLIQKRCATTTSKTTTTTTTTAPTGTRVTSFDDYNYQYLQTSEIPMLHFQRSLPRLPIPKLEKTCERFLAACRPILSDAEYTETQKVVSEFQNSDGLELQKILMATDMGNKHTSYISQPWFDNYLIDRKPLPINYNPVIIMKNDDKLTGIGNSVKQLIRTTNLIIHSLRFMRSLYAKQLEPEVYHLNGKKSDTKLFKTITKLSPQLISTYVAYTFNAFPLDMSQYNGLFGGTRLPRIDKDEIYRNRNTNANVKHIILMRNGHIYAMDVLDDEGNIERPNIILSRLYYILNDKRSGNDAVASHPIGILTTEDRNVWAGVRQHMEHHGNRVQLNTIDSALFVCCLDNVTTNPSNPMPMVKNMLCGNGENRWFDKSISLIVAGDGTAAINFEHSWGDGVAVLRYFNEIYKAMDAAPIVTVDNINDYMKSRDNGAGGVTDTSIQLIHFHFDDKIQRAVKVAQQQHHRTLTELAMHSMVYGDLNKRVCKQYGVSPDAIMQLGFQLAYAKQNRKYVGTYESCSTSAFRHGRTETLRPCTMATKTFCDAIMANGQHDATELRHLLQECSQLHGRLTKEAAMGQGFDRHLFGLRNMAQVNKFKKSKLFTGQAYKLINHNIISTSTLASPALMAGAFGPVCPDGYGIGYNIQDELLGTIVTSYPTHRNGYEFVECLAEAFRDIKVVLEKGGEPRAGHTGPTHK